MSNCCKVDRPGRNPNYWNENASARKLQVDLKIIFSSTLEIQHSKETGREFQTNVLSPDL